MNDKCHHLMINTAAAAITINNHFVEA